jgi:hypothetical protein
VAPKQQNEVDDNDGMKRPGILLDEQRLMLAKYISTVRRRIRQLS